MWKKLAPVNSGARFMSFRVATVLINGSERCFHVCQPVTSTGESGSAWQRADHCIRLDTECVSRLGSAQLQADRDGFNVDTEAVSKPSAQTLQTALLSVCDFQKCCLCRQLQRF